MKDITVIILSLLLACLCAGATAAMVSDPALVTAGALCQDEPPTPETESLTRQPGEMFTLIGVFWHLSTGQPRVGVNVTLQELAPAGNAYTTVHTNVTDQYGRAIFVLSREEPGMYRYRLVIQGEVWQHDWVVIVTEPSGPPVPPSATIEQVLAYYNAGGRAWGQAWEASDVEEIRLHLNRSESAYANCLNAALTIDDPGQAGNLGVMKSVSSAYIGLAQRCQ